MILFSMARGYWNWQQYEKILIQLIIKSCSLLSTGLSCGSP